MVQDLTVAVREFDNALAIIARSSPTLKQRSPLLEPPSATVPQELITAWQDHDTRQDQIVRLLRALKDRRVRPRRHRADRAKPHGHASAVAAPVTRAAPSRVVLSAGRRGSVRGMLRRIALGIALVALGGACAGEQPGNPGEQPGNPGRATQRERFNLFNDCAPIRVTFSSLTRPHLEAPTRDAAESRLRAARLFDKHVDLFESLRDNVGDRGTDTSDRGSLIITIAISPESGVFSSYEVHLTYRKPVMDLASGLVFSIPTWQRLDIGRADDPVILSAVSRLFDEFLAAYLRVNAEACP